MNFWEGMGIGFGVGVLFASLKDWVLIQNLLNRIQFQRPEDFFYAQHITQDLEKQRSGFGNILKKLNPLTKKDKPVTVLTPAMAEKEIKDQIEKQETDEKELDQHMKAFEAQRRIQLQQGEM